MMLTALLAILISLPAAQEASDPDQLTIRLAPGTSVRADQPIDLQLSRPLRDSSERVAVLIDGVDWSGLTIVDGTTCRIRPEPIRLPEGETTVVAYRVTAPNEWRALGRFTVRVTGPSRFETATLTPKADLTNAGQLGAIQSPAPDPGARNRFQDATLTTGVASQHTSAGVTVTTQLTVVGVTNRTTALRFGLEGDRAPKLDLADYAVTLESDRGAQAAIGHVTFGTHRNLVNALASRGFTVGARWRRADLRAALLNGNSIVGFANPFGLSTPANQVSALVLGSELAAARPGGARLEVSLVDGSRLPVAGVAQGQVNDAERSRGVGLRFQGADRAQRLRVDAGIARSRFTNPADPLLAQTIAIVPVREQTDDAQYLDATYDVLRGTRASGAPFAVAAAYRFERVDPLFRSVGVAQAAPADVRQHTLDLTAAIGAVAGQLTQVLSRDNLGEVASILTTHTAATTATLTVPLASIGPRPHVGLPLISYSLIRARQSGSPASGSVAGTRPSPFPDQASTAQTIRAEWTLPAWSVAYSLNHSLQDNRQAGREAADLANQVHAISLQARPSTQIDVSGEIGFERANNFEFDQTGRTARLNVTANWRIGARSSVSATFTRTALRDAATPAATSVRDLNVQFTRDIPLGRRGLVQPKAQVFLRANWQANSVRPSATPAQDDRRTWALTSGLTMSVF
jgi:hypothetical protein